MRVLPLLAEAGVEVELRAAGLPRLLLEPREQPVGVALAAVRRGGDEVVDVEVLLPGEELVDAEARDRGGLLVAVGEDADQPVAARRWRSAWRTSAASLPSPGRSSSRVRAARAVSPGPISRTLTRATLAPPREAGVVDGEEPLGRAAARRPTAPAARPPSARARACAGRERGEERVVGVGERVAELGGDRQPRARDEAVHRGAVEELEVADARGLGALGGPRRRSGCPPAAPRRAPRGATRAASRSSGAGSRDVLEHVREHREVVGAVVGRDVLAVVGLDPPRARDRARPRELDGGRRELEAVEDRRDAALAQLGQQRAVAAADLHHRRAGAARRGRTGRTAWSAFERAPSARQRPSRSASARSASE